MGQVGSVCACNWSQSLALPSEKALPVGHPDRRDSRICNGNLFGGALMQRRTAVTMRQDADVSQQHFAPVSRLKRVVLRSERISPIPCLNSPSNEFETSLLEPLGARSAARPGLILGVSATRKLSYHLSFLVKQTCAHAVLNPHKRDHVCNYPVGFIWRLPRLLSERQAAPPARLNFSFRANSAGKLTGPLTCGKLFVYAARFLRRMCRSFENSRPAGKNGRAGRILPALEPICNREKRDPRSF